MPLPVVLLLFLAHSVPSLVVRAVGVQTAAWITENRESLEGAAARRAAGIPRSEVKQRRRKGETKR